MGPDRLFGPMAVSSTGMAAERLRMEVIANNIANAQTTHTPSGDVFRRQDVIFATDSGPSLAPDGSPSHGGVKVVDIVDDDTPLQRLYMPGHPEADGEGYVTMPNVQLPTEMVNLLTAMRSYEANVKAAQAYRQISEQSLSIMRGS